MQFISAIAWFPTAALICGLVFGVVTLSCACLMIKEQRHSGISLLLAVLGTLLLIVSIWQSRSGTINELQAKIAGLEQQNRKLAKELEETTLQTDETQRKQQIETLHHTQTQIHQSFTEVRQQIGHHSTEIQQLSDKLQQLSTDIQNQLKDIYNSYLIKIAEHEQMLNKTMDQIAQLKSAFTSVSTDHSEQLEALEKQRKDLAKRLDSITTQHQTDLKSLREDVEATSQGQELNLVKASTQRDLSALRRDVQQMQTNLQQLQGRRHRAP